MTLQASSSSSSLSQTKSNTKNGYDSREKN